MLVARCGLAGPVFAYHSPFECRVIRELAGRFPDLAADLWAILDRVVDLLPITRNRYYHPSQHGNWSLKAVLPAAVPDLSYDALDGVANGDQAVAGYQEAIHPATPPERKTQIEAQLHAYCHLDTLALVRIWKLFSGAYAVKPWS